MTHGWLACGGTAVEGKTLALSPRPLPEALPKGTLALEITLPRGAPEAHTILHHASRSDVTRMFTLHLSIDGRLVLTHLHGQERMSLSLDLGDPSEIGTLLRVIYSWSAEESLLTAEAPEAGLIRQRSGGPARPLTHPEALALLAPRAHGHGMIWVALGDHRQPIGPAACFAPATPLDTPDGPRPAAHLRAGELLLTERNGPQPVLWSGRVHWPALGSFAPVRLNAGPFGARDLWLLPAHRIAVSGTSVLYHFDEEEILVEARHLVNGTGASQMSAPKVLAWQGILLKRHQILFADGCKVESLYTGGIGAAASLAATTAFAEAAAEIGLQKPCSLRELTKAEAMTLISARAQSLGPVAA